MGLPKGEPALVMAIYTSKKIAADIVKQKAALGVRLSS
jgi:hypothetical protein